MVSLLGAAAMIGTIAVAAPVQAAAATESKPKLRYDDLPDGGVKFAVSGGKWTTTNLTYWFVNDTPDLNATTERNAVLDAFGMWSRQTPLRFSQATSAAAAHIRISWGNGDHGDGYPFDGPSGVLAHAFYPPPVNSGAIAGDAHFDDGETWTAALRTTGGQPIDLVTVAAHEFGHSLGLKHSGVGTALMYPYYSGSHRWLDPDDIAGIRSLYGGTPGNAAWVWGDQPTAAACYTPSTSYQWNSSGGTAQVCRTGTGTYQWRIPNLGGAFGDVQVSSYGGVPRRCKVVNWYPSGASMFVNLACFTMTGVPADTYFEARFQNGGPAQPLQGAYLWSSNAAASHTPPAAYSWNSFGTTNTVVRNGVGNYTANLPGFTRTGGTVHVTAYGTDNRHCKVNFWGTNFVGVLCFTPAGALADSRFTLAYSREHLPTVGGPGAYGWTQDVNGTISSSYTWHSGPHTVTGVRNALGVYTVTIPGVKPSASTNAHVTAYGAGAASCQVGGWFAAGSGTSAQVRCSQPNGTPSGTPVDTYFTVSYLAN